MLVSRIFGLVDGQRVVLDQADALAEKLNDQLHVAFAAGLRVSSEEILEKYPPVLTELVERLPPALQEEINKLLDELNSDFRDEDPKPQIV